MSNVARLEDHVRRRRPFQPLTSEAFDEAWSVYPEIGRKRSSRIVSWPAWNKVHPSVGEGRLLKATKAFSIDLAELAKECGAPGFHRWLIWGRWEHWLDKAEVKRIAASFEDETIRANFYARFSDPRARQWFDKCQWDENARVITSPPWALKAEWIKGPWRSWAEENCIKGLRITPP